MTSKKSENRRLARVESHRPSCIWSRSMVPNIHTWPSYFSSCSRSPSHLPILLVPVGDMLGRMFCFESGGCGFLSFRKEKKHKNLTNCWLGLGWSWTLIIVGVEVWTRTLTIVRVGVELFSYVLERQHLTLKALPFGAQVWKNLNPQP